jgi:hypothetical protein
LQRWQLLWVHELPSLEPLEPSLPLFAVRRVPILAVAVAVAVAVASMVAMKYHALFGKVGYRIA